MTRKPKLNKPIKKIILFNLWPFLPYVLGSNRASHLENKNPDGKVLSEDFGRDSLPY